MIGELEFPIITWSHVLIIYGMKQLYEKRVIRYRLLLITNNYETFDAFYNM